MKIKNFSIFKVTEKTNESQPDYRISARLENDTFVEVGAGWKKEGEKGAFISCKLKDTYQDRAGFFLDTEESTPQVADPIF